MSGKTVHTETCIHKFIVSFTYNRQEIEAIKMSFRGWMNKQTVVHIQGILFSNKEMSYKATKTHKRNLNAYSKKKKKPIWKDYILYMILTIWQSGKGKTKKTIKTSVVTTGWGWG